MLYKNFINGRTTLGNRFLLAGFCLKKDDRFKLLFVSS
jgi:hypothetical protein